MWRCVEGEPESVRGVRSVMEKNHSVIREDAWGYVSVAG